MGLRFIKSVMRGGCTFEVLKYVLFVDLAMANGVDLQGAGLHVGDCFHKISIEWCLFVGDHVISGEWVKKQACPTSVENDIPCELKCSEPDAYNPSEWLARPRLKHWLS